MKTPACLALLVLAFVIPPAEAQLNYVGVFPSVLIEPYDALDALEVNLLPLVLGFELAPGVTLELRPLVDGQFVAGRAMALSHLGGTLAVRTVLSGESPGITWHMGGFFSANYNAVDGGVVVIGGFEPGVTWTADDRFSLTFAPQPGLDWFPSPRSGQETLLPHFGLVVHLGWNLTPASWSSESLSPGADGFSPPPR